MPILSSREDIERLRSSRLLLWKLDGPIELAVPGLSPGDRERLEYRLNDLAGTCGCAEASGVGAFALIAIVVWWMRHEIAFTFRPVAAAVTILIGTMLLAKLLRVLIARIQLHITLGTVLTCERGATP